MHESYLVRLSTTSIEKMVEEVSLSFSESQMPMYDLFCVGCPSELIEPYIRCAECPTLICLNCLAKGFENELHLNNHSYEIVRNDFWLYDPQWTAAEETKLLEAMTDCGFGNWVDIANQVQTKSKEQCESHYYSCYVDNPKPPLPEFSDNEFVNPEVANPITFKCTEDPPRPVADTQLSCDMAGYMAARGDFATEYDNYAELDICDMEFSKDDDEADKELKLKVLEIYNRRLYERAWRKKIIRNYGLLNVRKALMSLHRFDKTLGRRIVDSLLLFMRLVSSSEFDILMESLHYEFELKQKIKLLQEFRSAGIKRFHSTNLYMQLKQCREENKYRRTLLDNILDHMQDESSYQNWLQRQLIGSNAKGVSIPPVMPALQRKPAPPLDIVGLPGYEKLETKEKELCTFVRLVPDAYLEFKTILIAECQKNGFLRLAQARNLIKIDVNKTRKIYDFLVSEGLINKEQVTTS